jgi:plasmid stabilization system protein ParE
MRSLIVEDEARADINEAHDWYEEKEPGLGARFESHLDDALAWIDENVGLCREVLPGVHRYNLRVFPYSLFIAVTDTEIRVLGVLHGARAPDMMRRRTGQE